jgi:F-box protein 25/32
VNCLPEECVREILLRLSDSKDLERAGRACQTMNTIAREKRVWRELVQTHFSKQQVSFFNDFSLKYQTFDIFV